MCKQIFRRIGAQFSVIKLLIKQWLLSEALPNFHRITPHLFRSGQPTEKGIKKLKKLGVKTIISFRPSHKAREMMDKLKIKYENLGFSQFSKPSKEQILKFLKLVHRKENHPICFHCLYGADRTGIFCAIYRIVIENWPTEKAIHEMTNGGFGYHWWIPGLPEFIRKLNITEFRKELGIA